MPVVFVGHGSPMNAILDTPFSTMWRQMGERLPKPRAILCISAHWETRGTSVTTMERPQTIHDFGGFPDELYRVQYPAPGFPTLADQIRTHTQQHVTDDASWGLDHGAWSILRHWVPDASIPVVQLSLDRSKGMADHMALGQELAALRRKGVLILGSGNCVHNLGRLDWVNENGGYDWAIDADKTITQWVINDDRDSLVNAMTHSESIRYAIPTPEHFLPLLYVVGATEATDSMSLFNQSLVMGSLSMTSFIAQ